jgi:hypothetical protein
MRRKWYCKISIIITYTLTMEVYMGSWIGTGGSNPGDVGTNGKIGVGTTSPSARVDICGTNGSDATLRLQGDYSGNVMFEMDNLGAGDLTHHIWDLLVPNSASFPLQFISYITGGSGYITRMMIAGDSGNVGIGTTSPQNNLHIVYPYDKYDTSERFAFEVSSNDTYDRHGLKISSIGGASQSERKYIIQTHEAGLSNTGNLDLQPFGGRVGIGTTSPGYKLDIQGSTIRQLLNVQIAASSGIGNAISATADQGIGVAGYCSRGGQDGAGIYGYAYGYATGGSFASELGLALKTGTGNVVLGGSVGIGLPSLLAPMQKLDVNGNILNRGNIEIYGGIETHGALQYDQGQASQSGTTVTGYNSAAFTPAMVGSIIIFLSGETAHITGYIDSTHLTVAESRTVVQNFYEIHYLGFKVTSGGNVGIGTTSPASKLHVGNDANNTGYITLEELGTQAAPVDPPAPVANKAVLYLKDNGSGKTRLMVRFSTGSPIQLAIQP